MPKPCGGDVTNVSTGIYCAQRAAEPSHEQQTSQTFHVREERNVAPMRAQSNDRLVSFALRLRRSLFTFSHMLTSGPRIVPYGWKR